MSQNLNYTSERHTQILIALLKYHGINKIIACPGSTSTCLVGSLQQDSSFEIYSSVDERSAAYIACGMAAESGKPVALVCTGSTASRNFVPGLTEAYYRNLPVLAITATQYTGRIGNLYQQVIDRSKQMNDLVKESVLIDCIYTGEDIWSCELKINKALLALTANGGGPAHINLVTTYSRDYSVKQLPKVKAIDYIETLSKMPSIRNYKHIAILVGVHGKWSQELQEAVEAFCKKYDAVVLRNHACNYKGKFGVNHKVVLNMPGFESPLPGADLVIYIGSVARYSSAMNHAEMWRVSPDGKVADSEKKLTKIFRMAEVDFFRYYADATDFEDRGVEYSHQYQDLYEKIMKNLTELPFSNVWIAKDTIDKIPDGAVLHLAGSNTANSWNYFKLSDTVECYSNDGTMGIDGQVSALIGESLASPKRLHFGVVGDLTFFYDMNSLGNRHIKNNLRLLIVNNGKGIIFKMPGHPEVQFGELADQYITAAGHYGNKSPNLLRHYAEDLGFEYLTASTKEEYITAVERFTIPELTEKPMIFEVFTEEADEIEAIDIMNHLVKNTQGSAKSAAKDVIMKMAGEKGIETVKRMLGKK